MSVKRLCLISMMLSIAIVVNLLESFIPMFVPGVKLGLANIIILIMLYEFRVTEAFFVDLLRIILAGLLRGSFLTPTFLMSLGGGMLSFLVMLFFSRMKIFSVIGVSVLGSISHATGQIIVAIILLSTKAVLYYLPFIALLSLLTGIFSGVLTKIYLKRSITQRFLKENGIE
ncbi:MAG: Gx transporter family protein [Anaeroplasmataceae bacterium]|nr:Gx transporter family protein [Anaeroplasmataceae bacterium]